MEPYSATERESPHSIPEIIDTQAIEIPVISVKMQVVCGNKKSVGIIFRIMYAPQIPQAKKLKYICLVFAYGNQVRIMRE